jgi:hypothetical protein
MFIIILSWFGTIFNLIEFMLRGSDEYHAFRHILHYLQC